MIILLPTPAVYVPTWLSHFPAINHTASTAEQPPTTATLPKKKELKLYQSTILGARIKCAKMYTIVSKRNGGNEIEANWRDV